MIQRRAPLKRSTKPLKRCRVRARRPGAPRRGPANIPADEWRNPAYLDFLATECACVVCASLRIKTGYRIDPAHGPVNGMKQKGPDAGAIPLCRIHHDKQTEIGWPAFEAFHEFSREREAAAHFALFKIWKEGQA